MPEMPDVITGEEITSEWGNDIRDRTVQRYATTAERSALNPAPSEGELAYMEDSNRVEVFDGSTWGIVGPAVTAAVVMDGATDLVQDLSTTATWENGATVTFTIPATWTSYDLMAWGDVIFHYGGDPGAVADAEARISIGGVVGTAVLSRVQIGVDSGNDYNVPTPARHHRTGLTATATVIIQYRKAAGGSFGFIEKRSSILSLIAIRKT